MTSFCGPHTTAFPDALGTGIIIQTGFGRPAPGPMPGPAPDDAMRHGVGAFIDAYESALSRFRADSTVAAMRRAAHGGAFAFPDWAGPLFDLADLLCEATDGSVDPCVGEDLIRLGYDAAYSFTVEPDAFAAEGDGGRLGALHGRPTWRDDVERRGPHGATLVTKRAVSLDFGACGKGYLVDLLAGMVRGPGDVVIDAGGDMLIDTAAPIAVALEDPDDGSRAAGVAHVGDGAFCASAPSRRRWGEMAGHRLHHLLDAVDGMPVDDVAATWVHVPVSTSHAASHAASRETDARTYPTGLADGLATALFVADPNTLHDRLRGPHGLFAAHGMPDMPFECAVLRQDRTAVVSRGFPGSFFTA